MLFKQMLSTQLLLSHPSGKPKQPQMDELEPGLHARLLLRSGTGRRGAPTAGMCSWRATSPTSGNHACCALALQECVKVCFAD